MKLMEPFEHSSIQQSAAEHRQPTECSLRIHITKRPPMRARTYLALPTASKAGDRCVLGGVFKIVKLACTGNCPDARR